MALLSHHCLYLLPCLFLVLFTPSVSGRTAYVDNSAAVNRAKQTLSGLLHYYWSSDPYHKKVKYFLVCGQTGGVGGSAYNGRCTCEVPSSCVNCYRWYDAVTLESVATYGIYMDTKNNSAIPDTIFNHSPYNAEWNATAACTFIDDFSWYGLAYLRVYEWLKVRPVSVTDKNHDCYFIVLFH